MGRSRQRRGRDEALSFGLLLEITADFRWVESGSQLVCDTGETSSIAAMCFCSTKRRILSSSNGQLARIRSVALITCSSVRLPFCCQTFRKYPTNEYNAIL